MLNRMIAFTCVLALLPALATAQSLSIEKGVTSTEKSATPTPAAPVVPVKCPRLAGTDNPPPAKQHRKDSLWNGVIIGAGLGALVGTLVSFAVSDCSECSGFNVPLTFGVLGAGAGAGIGAGIDAWHQKRDIPAGSRRRTASPVSSKDLRGILARIPF